MSSTVLGSERDLLQAASAINLKTLSFKDGREFLVASAETKVREHQNRISGVILGPFLDRSGDVLGSFWGRSELILGTF